MESLKVTSQHRAPLKKIAASLRRRADQVEPSYSTMQIIDACFPDTIVTGRVFRPGIEEMVRVHERAFNTHRAPHVIYYNREMSTGEQRFAIAHALGHIIFDGKGHDGRCAVDAEREQRCDRFAEELLVPLDELRPFVCAWPSRDPSKNDAFLDMSDQISSHFHVPARVIHKRIRELRRPRRVLA
jgi:Zn-dependent peptidase ImmA (M78 family)